MRIGDWSSDVCSSDLGVGARPFVPEPDQQVGGEADALPPEEHLHEVVGRHQHQHEEGEQAEIGEEARLVGVVRHVADGVDVHHGGDAGRSEEHTSELQSLMRMSYAVFCLNKKNLSMNNTTIAGK